MPPWSVSRPSSMTQPIGFDLSTSRGVNISGTTANTKSGYGELIPSTSFDADGICVFLQPDIGAGTNTQTYLVDIAMGAGGSEVIFIPNIPVTSKRGVAQAVYVPIAIPAGVRLSARCQTLLAASNPRGISICASLFQRAYTNSNQARYKYAQDYGTNLSDSGGAQVDPGATANTKGAWSEIVSSTSRTIRQIIIYVNLVNNPSATLSSMMMDIGIGAAGSEIPLLQNLRAIEYDGIDGLYPAVFGPYPVYIPEGTRLSARAQSTTTDSTDRLFDVAVLGVG